MWGVAQTGGVEQPVWTQKIENVGGFLWIELQTTGIGLRNYSVARDKAEILYGIPGYRYTC